MRKDWFDHIEPETFDQKFVSEEVEWISWILYVYPAWNLCWLHWVESRYLDSLCN